MLSTTDRIFRNKNYLVLYLFIYLFFQISLIVKAGTTWDDLKLIETTPRIIHKFNLFFTDPTNGFLSEFVSNFEFYGYLVLVPAYLFSKNDIVINLFSFIFKNIFNINIINNQDLEYILRHIFLSIYVVFSLFIMFKLYSKISDEKRSFQFIVILSLIPAFSGHALFNLKDVPYMIQNFIATLFFINYLIKFHKANYYDLIKVGLFFGLLLLIRFNGLALIAIYYFFSYLYLDKDFVTIKKNTLNLTVISFISLFVLFIGTPSAWQKPKLWIEKTIETQFNIYWDSYVLTNGSFTFAMDVNPLYLLTWFNFRLPVIVHIFLGISIYLLIKGFINKSYNFSLIYIFSLYFLGTILFSFMVLRPVVYDGIRQYLFLLPFFILIVTECINNLNLKKIKERTLFLSIVIYLLFTSFGLGPYRYTYFNELTNVSNITIDCDEIGGCGNWQTDYWGYSGKSLINNINQDFEGDIYLCSPEHVFSTYLVNEKVNVISEPEKVKDEFYVLYLHRPMLKNDICGFKQRDINVTCEIINKEEVNLRFNPINLSYLSLCNKS